MKCNSEYCNIKEAFIPLLKGNKGNKGPQGVQGSVGDIGLRGLDGPIGPQGPQGDSGIMGQQGFKGDRGKQGQQGRTGSRGNKGVIGIQGKRGDKGPKGWKGPRGDMGNRAENGVAGIQGPIGKTGASGKQFSNIGVSRSGCLPWKENVDHHNSMMGNNSKSNNSRQNNYCPEGYGMTGIKTSAWQSSVKTYVQQCKTRYVVPSGNKTTCWTKHQSDDGIQILRKYSMKCCPTYSQDSIKDDEKIDNLDEYKNYNSIRNYPFHTP